MPEEDTSRELVELRVKVSPLTRYLFKKIANHDNQGATAYMENLVEAEVVRTMGDFALAGWKLDFEREQSYKKKESTQDSNVPALPEGPDSQ